MHAETYDFRSLEPKWQSLWDKSRCFRADDDIKPGQKKFYCLVMFPYPSGKIHMGHARNYCIGDVIARFKKMQGFKVLHPLGWDAFGLPAENAAIDKGIHPEKWTRENIREMGQDIKSLGISYDWDREFATCDAAYYRWNQWFFIQMFRKGLAYRKNSSVNWCDQCRTVLANEQVHDGACWRCHSKVTQKDLNQWFLKTSEYAERLLDDLKQLEGKWPEEVILMQSNWIGKSTGAEVHFALEGLPEKITVFTTRPDTLFGSTFLVLAPEHPLLDKLTAPEKKAAVQKYAEASRNKSKLDRTSLQKEKTGLFTGRFAVNPVNGKKVPVWVADYVLGDYGTGAIMAVPAHDQRDFEFAQKNGLDVIPVIRPQASPLPEPLEKAYEEEGVMVNSGAYDGLPSAEAGRKITASLKERGQGEASVTYRIRDWLISRQRFWGTPIPILHCPKCGLQPVPEKDLPVLLPVDVQITGKGESPLAQVQAFVEAACPACGGPAKRETDTMDTFVDSSWYFLRYCDPKNGGQAFDPAKTDAWMPVDQYIGGIEHACMHLIYSRFFYKVIKDLGLAQRDEPFERLLTQGMVTLGGSAMSKSKGNIVAVETMVKEYGADTARLFVLFASPPRNQLEWSEDGVQGIWRFLNRIWRLSRKIAETPAGGADEARKKSLQKKTHFTVKKVGEDLEKDFQFNTAISAVMELLNALSDYPALGDAVSRESFRTLLVLLFPFAPHLTSELWEILEPGKPSLDQVPFPAYDPGMLVETTAEIVIQVNGKVRGKFSMPAEDSKSEETVKVLALDALRAKGTPLDAAAVKSQKLVPGKLINFVVEQKPNAEVAK